MKTTHHTVLITGGATGIGLALAKAFHARGNRIILVGRRAGKLENAARMLGGACICCADITQDTDRAQLVVQYPDTTILINNAGIQNNGAFSAQSPDDIEQELNTNLTAPILLTHAFLPHLARQPEAAVINVTSGLALVPKENAAVYGATKAALRNFTQSLRWQLESTSVRVFELVPPLVESAMTQGRGTGKISPEALADIFWQAFERDVYDILAGKSRLLAWINRLAPKTAQRIMRKA